MGKNVVSDEEGKPSKTQIYSLSLSLSLSLSIYFDFGQI